MASEVHCTIHIERDNAQFEVVTRSHGEEQYIRLRLCDTASVFMSPTQLLILRGQINAWEEQR